jgi:hypothetical protein
MNAGTQTPLEKELSRRGWEDGAPPHLPAAALDIDLRTYRRMRCGGCGHRGHAVRPLRRGRDYRLLCTCRGCGRQTEA